MKGKEADNPIKPISPAATNTLLLGDRRRLLMLHMQSCTQVKLSSYRLPDGEHHKAQKVYQCNNGACHNSQSTLCQEPLSGRSTEFGLFSLTAQTTCGNKDVSCNVGNRL